MEKQKEFPPTMGERYFYLSLNNPKGDPEFRLSYVFFSKENSERHPVDIADIIVVGELKRLETELLSGDFVYDAELRFGNEENTTPFSYRSSLGAEYFKLYLEGSILQALSEFHEDSRGRLEEAVSKFKPKI